MACGRAQLHFRLGPALCNNFSESCLRHRSGILKAAVRAKGGGAVAPRGPFLAQEGRPPEACSCPAWLSGPRRAPREATAALCGSGDVCENRGDLAPLRPPPEWKKMPTHSGAGHDGRAQAGTKLHFPAASLHAVPGKGKGSLPRVGPAARAKPPLGGQHVNQRVRIRALAAFARGAGRNRLRLGPLAGLPANPRAERSGGDWAAGEAAS